jgi:hypothetical protein
MHVRLTAGWQQTLDDRIIEHLDDESWSTPGYMEMVPGIDATKAQIRDRCRVLADAGLVSLEQEEGWYVELTKLGELYLEGEANIDLYPRPRHPKTLEDHS